MHYELAVIFIKMLLSSGLMLAFFLLVLRNRASYRMQRRYLLLIPVVCVMMSCFRFEVYKPADSVVERVRVDVQQPSAGYDIPVISDDWVEDVMNVESVAAVEHTPATERKGPVAARRHTTMEYVLLVIFSVSVILLLLAVYSVVRLFRLRRCVRAAVTDSGYRMVRSHSVKVPFSFYDTIFLPAEITGNNARLIMMHEMAHIECKHHLDVWIMEFEVRLLWIVPTLWLTRRLLRNVIEFEADRAVVDAGADVRGYQKLLFQQSFGDCPVVATGFRQSFIRRRFMEMKKKAVTRFGVVGKIGLVVWFVLLGCAFTFAVGKAEVIVRYVDIISPFHVEKAPLSEVVTPEDIMEEDVPNADELENEKWLAVEDAVDADAGVIRYDSLPPTHIRIPKLLEVPAEYDPDDRNTFPVYGDVHTVDLPLGRRPEHHIAIWCTREATYLAEVNQLFWDEMYFYDSSKSFIRDSKTGKKYPKQSVVGLPIDQYYWIKASEGQYFCSISVYPPLPESCSVIDISWETTKLYGMRISTLQENQRITKFKQYK